VGWPPFREQTINGIMNHPKRHRLIQEHKLDGDERELRRKTAPPEDGDDWGKEKSMSSFGHERQKGEGDERSKRDSSSTHETVRNYGSTTVGGAFF
jgi:hypothetical protein